MQPRVSVTFSPAGTTVWVDPETTVAEAARAAGVLVSAPCAGRGVCAGCGVRVVSGELAPPDEVEQRTLRRAPAGVRLACRARVTEAVEVRPLFSAPSVTAGAVAVPLTDSGTAALVAGVDLGTTSVAALIVEAQSGREIARSSVANRQAAYGTDVLSRVSASLEGCGAELRLLAEQSVLDALGAAARAGGVETSRIDRLVVAGNSAMAGLLTGADVTGLSAHPFTPPTGGGALPADSIVRHELAPNAEAALVPPMAAFVGGDALAASLSAGLVEVDAPTLLVDLGTNAELVLARPEGLLVASTAAGPAFEGVGVSCGGPAISGAVDRVEVESGAVRLHAIDDARPAWLSGAGVVSAIATLVAVGHITADGAMVVDGPLSACVTRDEGGVLGVRLSGEDGPHIALTQLDVRTVQLAKAAVRAGIETLLCEAGVSADSLAEVIVAGAFGAALDPADLIAIGVLPSNVGGRVRRVGNAALEGAAALALDPALTRIADETAARAIHVDLAADASFNAGFVSAIALERYEA